MVRLAHRGCERNWLRDVEGLIPGRWGKQEGLEWRALARCPDLDRGHRGTCPERVGPRRHATIAGAISVSRKSRASRRTLMTAVGSVSGRSPLATRTYRTDA